MQNQTQQLPSESSNNYKLFCDFATLGFKRNITKFADKAGLSRQHIYNIANRNDWNSRLQNLDKEARNNISTSSLEKLVVLQESDLELTISSYESLHTAIRLANNAIQNYDSASHDFEHILKITSNFINQMNKYQKVNELLENKLEKYDLLTLRSDNIPKISQENNLLEKPKPSKNTSQKIAIENKPIDIADTSSIQNSDQKTFSKEEKQKIDDLKTELLELNQDLKDKSKLKSLGHTPVRKMHKRKKEVLRQLQDFLKN